MKPDPPNPDTPTDASEFAILPAKRMRAVAPMFLLQSVHRFANQTAERTPDSHARWARLSTRRKEGPGGTEFPSG
jgi:hypothetical protein